MEKLLLVADYIKKLYIGLNKLKNKLSTVELNENKFLGELIAEFSQPEKQWRKYTRLPSLDRLSDLIKILENVNEKSLNVNSLKLLNDTGKIIIRSIDEQNQGTSVWHSDVIEWEKELQYELKYILKYSEIESKLKELYNNYKKLKTKN